MVQSIEGCLEFQYILGAIVTCVFECALIFKGGLQGLDALSRPTLFSTVGMDIQVFKEYQGVCVSGSGDGGGVCVFVCVYVCVSTYMSHWFSGGISHVCAGHSFRAADTTIEGTNTR